MNVLLLSSLLVCLVPLSCFALSSVQLEESKQTEQATWNVLFSPKFHPIVSLVLYCTVGLTLFFFFSFTLFVFLALGLSEL